MPESATDASLRLALPPLPPGSRTRHGACWSVPRRMLMPTYLSPGVYVEEMEAGARPIEGVGTAVAAFVGLASAGSVQRPDPRHELEPVHLHLRRFRRGLLPAPRRVRLLPERRRRLLRRAHRRQRCGFAGRPGGADGDHRRRLGRGCSQPWAPSGCRRWPRAPRATTSRSRSPTPPRRAPPRTPSSWWSRRGTTSKRPSTT